MRDSRIQTETSVRNFVAPNVSGFAKHVTQFEPMIVTKVTNRSHSENRKAREMLAELRSKKKLEFERDSFVALI